MKVSIVVPIYNVEKYIDKCLNSLVKSIKNYDNIEILLIDDGSTDNSKKKINEYDKKYSFIKAFYKNNGGLSDARNYGLIKAIGDYVIFIDSDDEVDPILFNEIITKIEKSDSEVVLWDAMIIDENGKKNKSSLNDYYIHNGLKNSYIYSGIELINVQLKDHSDLVTTVWLGAYKKDFIIRRNLFFEKGLLHEDEMWTIKVFLNANKVEYINKKAYMYRQREDSIMNKQNKDYRKNVNDVIYIYNSLYSYINWISFQNIELNKLKGNISRRYLHALGKFDIYKYKREKKKINFNELFKNSIRTIDKIRCLILKISPYIYCKISKINGGKSEKKCN